MLRLRRGSIVCNRNWLVNAKLLSSACACQKPMSSTLTTIIFIQRTPCLRLWGLISWIGYLISHSSLNRPQSSCTEILIALIIMPNTIPEEHAAHFTGCVIPFLIYVQCRGTTVPVPLDYFTYIGITMSSSFEILDQRQWMDGFSQSSELDQQFNQRYTCPKSIHFPTSTHKSTTSKAPYSRHTCTRYCLGSTSASLVSGYGFLLGLILGSEYGYISRMVDIHESLLSSMKSQAC